MYLKYSNKNPLLNNISYSEELRVFNIRRLLSVKKKNEGDLPPPLLKLYIPVMFLFGINDSIICSSVILPLLKFLKS